MTQMLENTERTYGNGHDRPLGGYVGILATYGAGIASAAALAVLTKRRPPERVTMMDLLLMAACTHKVSRRLAKDPVMSPLRAPFTTFEGESGPSEVREAPRGPVGELLACPFCVAQWAATAYAIGLVFAPGITRLVGATMTAVAVSDWLQLGYARLMRTAG
jgi:hypothetical protein